MIKLQDKLNTTAPNVQNPYGQIQDDDGTGNGTPVTKDVYQDHHIFFEKLMAEAGITPNGLLDNAYDGFQLFQAFQFFMGGLVTKVVEIGPKDFTAGGGGDTTFLVPHGLSDPRKIRSVSLFVQTDSGSNVHNFLSNPDDGVMNKPTSTTNIQFNAINGGYFDVPEFSGTTINRGWCTIVYDPSYTP